MPLGTAPAPAAGSPAPQAAPFGQTSAVGPTPNRGHEAAGLQKLGLVVKGLQDLVPLVGAGSDAGQAVLDALKKLSKFVPAGSVTPAAERNQLESMAMKQGQQNQQLQALKAMQAQGAQQQAQPQAQQKAA